MYKIGGCTIAGIVCAITLTISPLARADKNWPQFRGPGSTGVTEERQLPESWSANGRRDLEGGDSRTRLVIAGRLGRPRLGDERREFERFGSPS